MSYWVFHSSFSPTLIIFSVFIAIISSYTTLVLVGRIFDANRSKKMIWLLSGAFVMATGIYSMHFIAMISYYTDYPVTYDIFLLLLSFASAILFSFTAFYILYVPPLTKTKILISGLTLGIGIVILHYIAIFAVNEPVEIQLNSIYVTLSIVISLGLSSLSIKMFVKNKDDFHSSILRTILSAVVLGIAVSAMHYTGMRATHYVGLHHYDDITTGIDAFILVGIISFSTLFIMIVALYFGLIDYRSLQTEKVLLKQIKESEVRYRRLVELSPEPIIVHDGKVIMFVNQVCLRILNASDKNNLIGKPIMDFVPANFSRTVKEQMQTLSDGGQIKSNEQQIIALDGSIIDVEVAGIGILYENKHAFQLVLRDITEQKRIRRELEEKKQQYQSLFEYNPDLVFSMDQKGFYTELNSSVWDLLGYSKEELLCMSFHKVVDPHYLDMTISKFKSALEGIPQNYEINIVNKNGIIIPASIKNIPIIIDGKVVGVYGIAKDLSKEKEAIQKIKELAYTDQLTGLPNRTWFYKNLAKVLNKSKELKETVAILAIDFDNFKNVNDTLGHHVGDQFLRQVSERLKNCLRENDSIARVGGDEFIITVEDVTKDEVSQLAKRILKETNRTLNLFGHEIVVTLSIGISMHSNFPTDVETVIKQADLALYLAKAKGKNNYQFFTEALNERVTRKLKLESSLRKAIEQKELKLFYQPQVDIQTRKLVGLETLLRWNPSYGFVSPSEFIPIAEETGLIVPLGEWVIKEACRQIKEWEKHELLRVPISVNVSARQFKDPYFIWKVKQIVREAKIEPHFLEIEITESVMFNVDESSVLLQDLRRFGIKVAVDDFGTGYSSLHLIANLDFDSLKIDKSLIDDSITNERKMVILKAIIGATNNHVRIVIEGIETIQQVNALKSFSVIGQGYFYSPPLPPEQLEQKVMQIDG
ncbi:bifunctional diguanylate cyclase/phosphodiesterase [Bacillus sp. Marseille-P3661]|uniref:bifunctional diguanylate cyclase/phosphodiesterase n=1 Tax=Bacillus sp. Marseille-P3661 TaxID=1936234 RepID=UPI0015E17FF2|nr:EAL domain-containing protein [Bacillus sp. Marseille-P3661]